MEISPNPNTESQNAGKIDTKQYKSKVLDFKN